MNDANIQKMLTEEFFHAELLHPVVIDPFYGRGMLLEEL